ncbi:MAG TPA: hypothetical protein VGU90_17070 [Terriglobales bacterium]|nr:hypothetical protein [Terriglobales bacterium]
MHSRITLIAVLVLSLSFFCHAQQTATCDHWTFFKSFSASGINQWNTVVGSATESGGTTGLPPVSGYTRWANAGVQKYKFPGATETHFSKRNAAGVTVGDVDFNHGLIVTGSSATTIDYPGAPQTMLTGINKWNSMVGTYQYNDDADFGPEWTGFKMWKNGTFTPIDAPGAINTNPNSISDTGTVVGWYESGAEAVPFAADPSHGFVLANGVYKTVDYPNAFRTSLNDINSAGVIVGSWINSDGGGGGFVVVNGKIKDVLAPGDESTVVNGINENGYVTGTYSGGSFIAHCQ